MCGGTCKAPVFNVGGATPGYNVGGGPPIYSVSDLQTGAGDDSELGMLTGGGMQPGVGWWPAGITYLIRGISVLGFLVFCGYLVYGLSSANTDAVRSACPNLWEFMTTRTVAGALVGLMLVMFDLFIMERVGKGAVAWQQISGQTWRWLLWLNIALFVYFSAFFVSSLLVVPRNVPPGGSTCTTALSVGMSGGSPVLGILGWVCLVCDGLLGGFFGLVLAYIFTMTPGFNAG